MFIIFPFLSFYWDYCYPSQLLLLFPLSTTITMAYAINGMIACFQKSAKFLRKITDQPSPPVYTRSCFYVLLLTLRTSPEKGLCCTRLLPFCHWRLQW